MKLIITGSCGHIGSYLAEKIHLIPKIKEVILIDNLSSNRYISLFNLKKKNNYKFFQVDLSKKKSLDRFKGVSYLVHCASMTNAERSFSVEKEMFRNNLDCMRNVINYCEKNKVKLIHLSSTSVYGKQTKVVDEKCEKKYLKPQSPYAKIKLIEEDMLKKNYKIQYNTFRLGTIAGYSKGMRFHTAVNKFCLNAAFNEKIAVYKTAMNQYRPYLSIRDSFRLFKFCIENNFFKNDIFNALSGNFTVKQIISKIKKRKKNVAIKLVKSKIMNQLSYHVDDSKIRKYGLKLNCELQKDIDDTLKLFKYLKN
jgi:nucleoside-diphosphate-sugar epimerase